MADILSTLAESEALSKKADNLLREMAELQQQAVLFHQKLRESLSPVPKTEELEGIASRPPSKA